LPDLIVAAGFALLLLLLLGSALVVLEFAARMDPLEVRLIWEEEDDNVEDTDVRESFRLTTDPNAELLRLFLVFVEAPKAEGDVMVPV